MRTPFKKNLALLALLAALFFAVGCDEGDDDYAECTAEARSSVTVNVTDENSNTVTDADVTYGVDGGAPNDCELIGANYVCGWEVEGLFLITVTKEGYLEEQREVTITSDECHVIGKTIDIQLQPE